MKKVAIFEKSTFNANVDHQSNVKEIFQSLGYTDFSIKTSLTNGCSNYVSLCLKIENAGKLPYDAWTFDDTIVITVRISDHASNLERFGGWEGQSNRCTLSFFKHLRDTGAIALSN